MSGKQSQRDHHVGFTATHRLTEFKYRLVLNSLSQPVAFDDVVESAGLFDGLNPAGWFLLFSMTSVPDIPVLRDCEHLRTA